MGESAKVFEARALEHLMGLLRVEGQSGQEGPVVEDVRARLRRAGCPASWIRTDNAHRRIGAGFETGNLIVRMPGTLRDPRRLFSAHLDVVPLCRGAEPIQRGQRIVARGSTGLGGDNRTGVACLVTLIETLLQQKLPHPPLTILFTVGEETGLNGARHVRLKDLGHPAWGFNIDSGEPGRLVVGAIGADRWEAEILGRSSHAGLHPEHGISAVLIAARAIAAAADAGFFGRVSQGRRQGTSNAGVIQGGEATNQVTHHVLVRGESRSHDPSTVRWITDGYRKAFARAATTVRDHRGRPGRVVFRADSSYAAFRLPDAAPVVQFAAHAVRATGLQPALTVTDGGLDANFLNAHGVPTVTFGAGQHGAHTLAEYVDVREFWAGCRLALELATAPDTFSPVLRKKKRYAVRHET